MSRSSSAVLVVDDSLTVRMDLVEGLQAAGLQPTACANLAEARLALAGRRFALVLLDLQLPDGEGLELLEELRRAEDPDVAATPVMVLSSEAEVGHRVRGLRLGATEYVGKPYDQDQVLGRARALIEARRASQDERAPRVLLIDDSPTVREEMRAALEEAGYEVLLAASGEEGLRLVAGLTPEALVVDHALPGIDGPTLIRRLRADARLRHVPCLLLTGSDGADQLQALDSGADAWVNKRQGPEVLLLRLGALLRSPRPQADPARPSLLAPKRLLVVDDSATYRHEVAEPLRAEGYDVALAASGEEALELLGVQPVDCVLLDLVMPGLTGHDTCRRIRATPAWKDVPVVMITAHDDHQSLIDAINSGADDYIAKATSLDVLKARVRAQLRRKQSEDEHRRAREELLHKELEALETRAARDLAGVLERKNRELQEQNRRVEEATRQKSEFLANMSHELRTPLNAIIGFSELIHDEKAGPLSAMQKEFLGDVLTSARHLLQLINDVLDLAKVEAGKMTFRPERVDVARLVGEVRDVARSLSARRAISVDVQVEDELSAFLDPGKLKQVLFNYVSNALKFTPEGGRVVVRARSEQGERLRLEVQDQGIGIAPEDLERLWVEFQQLDAGSSKRYQGTGLGLALTRRIVVAQGGTVGVESAVGRGSTFWAVLPRVAPAEGPAPADESAPQDGRAAPAPTEA